MKILVADDHPMMRDGLRVILEKAGLEVVGEAANGREAVTLAAELAPDIVLMDVSMPELNGVDATRRLLARAPECKVIGLSMNCDRRYVLAMFGAGAQGYLTKNSAAAELVEAIRVVASGRQYVSPTIAGVELPSVAQPGAGPPSSRKPGVPIARQLSAREREVLQLLAEGKSSKEMAARLGVAMATIETHRRQIMSKLGLRSVAELTKYAIREGLTSLD